MNSYNENLHSSVTGSLQSQELDLKKVKSQSNASMFTLYYSQGAVITATDRLETAKHTQRFDEEVKKGAVRSSNISNNMLKSANQANQYTQQSATNAAVAGANVQIAATAILKLASDIGSIQNLVKAANHDTEISRLTGIANQLISDTAYAAEYTSQRGLEASVLTSQVSSSTVLDDAKATNNAMSNLLKVVSDDFDKISKVVSAANTTLASISASEKSAEGIYEDIGTAEKATNSAYAATNKELNLGLTATPVAGAESTEFEVEFDCIRSPFKPIHLGEKGSTDPTLPNLYPVQDYYLIVVKENQKLTFSVNNAMDIIQTQQECYIPLKQQWYNAEERVGFSKNRFVGVFNYMEIKKEDNTTYELRDSDGDEITTGTKYVVFVVALYIEKYKQFLNTFDDFLSAPSRSFCLTYHLAPAYSIKCLVPDTKDQKDKPGRTNPWISFSVQENPDYSSQVEYRCILLPKNHIVAKDGMLNTDAMIEIEAEINEFEKLIEDLGPKITERKSKLMETETQSNELRAKLIKMEDQLPLRLEIEVEILLKFLDGLFGLSGSKNVAQQETVETAKRKVKRKFAFVGKLTDSFLELLYEYIVTRYQMSIEEFEIANLENQTKNTIVKINERKKSLIGFLFNITLAGHVSAANYLPVKYTLAKILEHTHLIPILPQPVKPAGKSKVDRRTPKNLVQPVEWAVEVTDATTDNFGNELIKGEDYLPVILSVSTAPEENLSKFTNAWSGYDKSPDFKAV